MSETLEARDVARDLSELARLSARADDVDALLRRVLDALADAIPYDLAAILELRDGRLLVRCARGPLAGPAVLGHGFAVSPGSAVERALETRRARVMGPEEHGAGLDPYHGVVELPDGHGCLVVPLVAADRALGVMTFDRARCDIYDAATVELATTYGQLVALALAAARHAQSLEAEKGRLEEQNRLLAAEAARDGSAAARLAGSRSPEMRRVLALARQVAVTSAPVLLNGETGTGKEVLARAIHAWSPRSEHPFVTLNCAALPESLLESELFGHVRGAFSGAERDRPGRFLVADRGTLLLDEIGDMPLAAQAKLLRVLQEGTFEPVGSDRTVEVDVRVIAATHVDLLRAIEQGRFRQDLYYRLSLFPLAIPPLRARRDDVAPIAERCLSDLARRTGRGPWRLSAAALHRLEEHDWPGNVRELVNALERATILQPAGVLDAELFGGAVRGSAPGRADADLPLAVGFGPSVRAEVWPTLEEVETDYLRRTLAKTRGRIYGREGAAALTGLKPTTLQSRLVKRGLSTRAYREGRVDDESNP